MPAGEKDWGGKSLRADIIAGTTTALVGIPQAMGFALVAGISPIYGSTPPRSRRRSGRSSPAPPTSR